ncbi:MAG: hypothetical protein Q9157_003803, partial [Trypethelium eluteriae]
ASSSSTRWKTRQFRDRFAKEARVQGLKSRAAFKLLELNEKHRLFRKGNTVVDLGYAPGSWSQVAISRVSPGGRVVGIDIIPAQPPRGVSTIQGNFLSEEVQAEVRNYVRDQNLGRSRWNRQFVEQEEEEEGGEEVIEDTNYLERQSSSGTGVKNEIEDMGFGGEEAAVATEKMSQKERDERDGRVVDVVLSDMSAPWEQTSGFYIRSLTEPYSRMMNTSGVPFRDHAGSMDLCMAALQFCYDTLQAGGHFVCKFYQGAEDKALEKRLKRLFTKVHRDKPESSRSESKEAYFVALKRKPDATPEEVFAD